MTQFDDRETAFESKFAHDAEMQFKAEARCNKLLGLWAAALLGRDGDAAQAYAAEVIRADFEEGGHEDVIRKLTADIGHLVAEEAIRAKRSEMLLKAKGELVSET